MKGTALILVVMSCISQATLPASEATDYTLGIFGNANMDGTIDEADIEYVREIIDSRYEATELSDANYDGRIDENDISQIELIIQGEEKEITIIDSADRIVTVKKPIERVVIAYWIDAALTLQALKADEAVVGVTDVIKDEPILFPELSKLPSVGIQPSPDALDYEKILELGPDVVLTGGTSMDPDEEIIERIQALDPNIRVLWFTFCVPSLYDDEVKKVGYIFNKRDEAGELINWNEEHLNGILEKVRNLPDDERTKVYTEFFMDYYTGGEGTAYQDYIEMAGGKNVFSGIISDGVYKLVEVDPEEIIERNPQVILHHLGMAYAGGYKVDDVTMLHEKREEIMDRSGFSSIEAVQNERVYTLDSNIVLCAIYPVGVSYYAKWFYPELFKDLDPKAIHQEYLTKFLGIDYDLSKHGSFVYPPQENPL